MAKVELRNIDAQVLSEVIELIEENNKVLRHILTNLDSNNIVGIDSGATTIRSSNGRLRIDNDRILILDSQGGVVFDASPQGVYIGKALN